MYLYIYWSKAVGGGNTPSSWLPTADKRQEEEEDYHLLTQRRLSYAACKHWSK